MIQKHVEYMYCTTCGEFYEKPVAPFGDAMTEPKKWIAAKLWVSGIDGSVFCSDGPSSIDDREIKINRTTGEICLEVTQ
jgi:hypothetical protein